jgi:hypothetical protein
MVYHRLSNAGPELARYEQSRAVATVALEDDVATAFSESRGRVEGRE